MLGLCRVKRITRYSIKAIIKGTDPTEKIYREFSTIKNVRKFARIHDPANLSFCWRQVDHTNKECIRMDSYYAFDMCDRKGLNKLTKSN
jgi:hypothetical protein